MVRVLDAWGAIAVFHDEPAADAVLDEIRAHGAIMSWINAGEAYYVELKRLGPERAAQSLAGLRGSVFLEEPDGDLVLRAARLKARGGISYADCFAVATAQRHEAAILTGDPEIIAMGGEVEVIDLRSP